MASNLKDFPRDGTNQASLILLKKFMSEETPPAKKAARKTVRKKSAARRTSKQSASSEATSEEKELPFQEVPSEPKVDDQSEPKAREPKTGVRDARRETADEPILVETIEKLVPSDDGEERSESPLESQNRGRQERNSENGSADRERQDGGDRRGRGRGRGGRERTEKRESQPIRAAVTFDTKDLAKKAWKIFQSEVTEEGLALLDDNGMRDYARNSFNAARIFLEEKERIVAREKQAKGEKKQREKPGKERENGDD